LLTAQLVLLLPHKHRSATVYSTAGAAASRKAPTAVPTVKSRVTSVGVAPFVVDCPGVMTRPFSSVAAAVGTGVASVVAATVGAAVGSAGGSVFDGICKVALVS
jgi:hypothetical protein